MIFGFLVLLVGIVATGGIRLVLLLLAVVVARRVVRRSFVRLILFVARRVLRLVATLVRIRFLRGVLALVSLGGILLAVVALGGLFSTVLVRSGLFFRVGVVLLLRLITGLTVLIVRGVARVRLRSTLRRTVRFLFLPFFVAGIVAVLRRSFILFRLVRRAGFVFGVVGCASLLVRRLLGFGARLRGIVGGRLLFRAGLRLLRFGALALILAR